MRFEHQNRDWGATHNINSTAMAHPECTQIRQGKIGKVKEIGFGIDGIDRQEGE